MSRINLTSGSGAGAPTAVRSSASTSDQSASTARDEGASERFSCHHDGRAHVPTDPRANARFHKGFRLGDGSIGSDIRRRCLGYRTGVCFHADVVDHRC